MVLIFHSFKGFSDLSQTLKNFSEDCWKTLGRLLGKSSNAFYSRILPMKSSGSLPKSFDQSDLSQTLENFSEDSWKTLKRLLGKSSNAFYAIRLHTKSSGSLLKSYAQNFFRSELDFEILLRRLFEVSQKTLGRLL
ncbi:hypothetical protein F2Q70_00002583 [Brassica cretica]|uniref:Uncharacterized protein n=1 Tax=Brassica cretica TaxID=69181 RepID=A0A8S9J3N3_BRACR|nr:hypothetical protein F2Q70_00002583 [Brassica cretica]